MSTFIKKKHVSKKRKIAWRKHVDIRDVDKFLDDKRLEERLGVPFSERPDESLFVEDKNISNQQEDKNISNQLEDKHKITCKKKALLLKPIRCFEILQPQSAVPDPITKRNRVRTPDERKHPIAKKKEEERIKNGILKKKDIDAAKNRAIAAAKRLQQQHKRGEFTCDLWNVSGKKYKTPIGENAEWLRDETLFHTMKNTRCFKKKVPKTLGKKTSILPALEPPHPGISYNPSFKDHQNLLKKVADDEIKQIKEEEHLDRVTTKLFSKLTREEENKNWLVEMSQGLPQKEDVNDSDSDSDRNEYRAINPPVKNVKKPLSKRKKLKESKKEEIRRREALVEKKKIADIYKLKHIEKEMDAKDANLAKLRNKREKVKLLKANEPKQLSKTKYDPLPLEFNLCEELTGNLRGVKPDGNLLDDRFKSFQRRNVVEVSVKQKSLKRSKQKKYFKSGYKFNWE